MNIKSKWVTAFGLRRAAVLAGAVSLTAGALVLSAGSAALAAGNGSEPGNLTLNPAGTATNPVPLSGTSPTWSTSDACPANFQGSAVVVEFNTDGTFGSNVSQIQQPAAAPFTNVALLPGNDMSSFLSLGTNITPGGTVEWSVECFSGSGGSGNHEFVQSTFVHETADGNNYFADANQGVQGISTTTTLTASPNPATVGATETLTAVEVAADSTHPAGNVQFEAGGTDIGSPVAVDATGTATLNTTAVTAVAGTQNLTAVFTPTSSSYSASTSAPVSLQVNCVTNCGQNAGGTNPVSISVTVPATGALSVTVAPGSVSLAVQGSTPPLTATGTLNQVTVSDTRNTLPGWSVSGQVTQPFTGSGTAAGATFSGDQLGWAPAAVGSLAGGATLGPAVTAGTNPGLQDAPQVLVSAAPGSGTGQNVVDAGLTLDIPTSAIAGPYTAMLTVTFLSTGP